MKAKISRNLLESGLIKCFDACEKRVAESMTQFVFSEKKLKLFSKGGFTFVETCIENVDFDDECQFTLQTSSILDFVRYISVEDLILIYDAEKKSCLLASLDKKSKLAFQVSNDSVQDNSSAEYLTTFNIANSGDFANKLNFASKFCAQGAQEYPLTGIHCAIEDNFFKIKSTNGPAFFQTKLDIKESGDGEFYLHKKTPVILKSLFGDETVKCSLNKNHMLVQSSNCNLKIYLEGCEKKSFPEQVTEWLDKEEECSIKISSHELIKTLKYLHGVMGEAPVKIVCQEDKLSLESNISNVAAKEFITIESSEGSVSSDYNIRLFLDCVDVLQNSWITLKFIKMQENFYLCKMTSENTITLLCPTTS